MQTAFTAARAPKARTKDDSPKSKHGLRRPSQPKVLAAERERPRGGHLTVPAGVEAAYASETMALKVLAFAGALRAESFNRKLIALAAEHARAQGADVDLLELREVPMPLYDGDLESAGLPAEVTAFRARIAAASAILIASPEYNASIPGTLKNAIDWASRPPSQPWRGKVVGLLGATPGPFATARMLPDLRKVLSSLGCFVVPSQLGVGRAGEAFAETGKLRDAGLDKTLEGVVREALETAKKLAAT